MKDKKSMVMVIIIGITLSLFLCFNTTVFATTGTVTTNDLRLRKDVPAVKPVKMYVRRIALNLQMFLP